MFSSSAVRPRRRGSAVALGAAIAGFALAAASPAAASTVWIGADGTLHFSAGRGEANALNATDVSTGNTMVLTDTGSYVSAGQGCVGVTPHEAQCTYEARHDFLIDLADRDDSARAFTFGLFEHVRISGGFGDDTIQDLPQFGADVSGGPGDDTILVRPNFGGSMDVHGGWGHDKITAISATGVVDGDVGDDDITLTTVFNPPGGTSAAYGGLGDDRITANDQTTMALLDGGFGNDTLTTTDFATVSVMNGGPGADAITAAPGHAEEINGGFGRDRIDGGGGGDTIDCGFGIDRYLAYDGDMRKHCEIGLTPVVPAV